MNLYIDDIRKLNAKNIEDYIVAKNFQDVKDYYETSENPNDPVDFIDIDYDLGQNEKTGLEILKWIVENKYDKNIKHINLHSSEFESRYKMKKYIAENFKNEIRITTNHS